jgi:hypothetical protein
MKMSSESRPLYDWAPLAIWLTAMVVLIIMTVLA